MIDPLGYLEFLCLLSCARLVLTDSGGIQEETTALGVPCLTLRENTERPVTVTKGTNHIVAKTLIASCQPLSSFLVGELRLAKCQNSGMDTPRSELLRFSCALLQSPESQVSALSINDSGRLVQLELQVVLDDYC